MILSDSFISQTPQDCYALVPHRELVLSAARQVQEKFTFIPFTSSGALVFSFVFQMGAAIPEDLKALPENTSLQRAVKQLYLDFGYIHEGAGFFF